MTSRLFNENTKNFIKPLSRFQIPDRGITPHPVRFSFLLIFDIEYFPYT